MLTRTSNLRGTDGITSRKLFWLSSAAAGSLGLYLLLALRYPLGPSLTNPRASWSSMIEATGFNATWHIAIYLGLTMLYLAIVRHVLASQEENAAFHRSQVILILITWSVCSVTLMFVAPAGESHDIFDYIFRGRMMTEYGANPLRDVPAEFDLSTPYVRYVAWRKHVDTYGPLWEIASATVSGSVRQLARWLGWWDENQPVCPRSPESCRLLILYITGYRLLAISLTGLSGWLIVSMVKRVQASLAPLALAVWLLNPLTLIATAVGAHNDAVMLVLALLSWWLLQRQQLILAVIVLVLAAHVKLTALLWLPVCALWIVWRWGWRRALQIGLVSAAISLILSWLLYVPFDGWQTLPRMLQERSAFLANSLWRILKYLLIHVWELPTTSAHRLTINLSGVLFTIGALLMPVRIFHYLKNLSNTQLDNRELDSKLWHALIGISMLYLLVGSFWFQHWYVLWALAPAALLPGSQFTRSLLPWLTFGVLCSNVAMDFLLYTTLKTSSTLIQSILVVVMIWGPILVAATILALVRRSSKKDSLEPARSYWHFSKVNNRITETNSD